MSRIDIVAAIAAAGLALADTAAAVDLRDWGRILPASERFVVLSQFNNQAVLDKESQLVWERSPATYKAGTRGSAALACTLRSTGARRGWRLPYLNELASLVDPTGVYYTLALPSGHPFLTVQKGLYWTATQNLGDASRGYTVNFNMLGTTEPYDLGSAAYYWCVRSAMPLYGF